MYARIVKMLLEAFPQTYSEKLGFSLESGLSGEVFKWFLTSLFFGKPTGEAQAMNTYRYFVKHGLTTPEGILDAGWERLVHVLDEKAMTKLRNYLKQLRENGAELVEVNVVVSKLLHESE